MKNNIVISNNKSVKINNEQNIEELRAQFKKVIFMCSINGVKRLTQTLIYIELRNMKSLKVAINTVTYYKPQNRQESIVKDIYLFV